MKKKGTPRFPPDEVLTEEERRIFREDMIIRRADQIRSARAEKTRFTQSARKQLLALIKRTRLLKRCRECGAMKFYLTNGGKAPRGPSAATSPRASSGPRCTRKSRS